MQHADTHAALVRRVLEAASLPQPARIRRVPEGIGNHVYFAGDVVVRLGTGSDAAMFPRAVAVLDTAAETVAVPRVLHADCSCSVFPVPVMALARVDGEPLSRLWATLSDGQRFDTVAAVANELSRLHAIGPDRVPDAGFSSPWWRERVSRIERLLLELRPTAGFPQEWLDHMARYLDEHRHALTTAPPPGVLHNDVNLGNVLIADGKVAALLDFDDALAGPPEEDWWQLLFRSIEAQPPLSLERIRDLPGVDLGAEGTLERFNIGEIQNVLDLLSGRLSWVDAETALADARETYEAAFLGDRHARILDRVT